MDTADGMRLRWSLCRGPEILSCSVEAAGTSLNWLWGLEEGDWWPLLPLGINKGRRKDKRERAGIQSGP